VVENIKIKKSKGMARIQLDGYICRHGYITIVDKNANYSAYLFLTILDDTSIWIFGFKNNHFTNGLGVLAFNFINRRFDILSDYLLRNTTPNLLLYICKILEVEEG